MPNSQVQVSLSVVEGRPAATSLKIAECFDKEHKNVLADIRNLLADCPDEFGRLNFQPSSYTNRAKPSQCTLSILTVSCSLSWATPARKPCK